MSPGDLPDLLLQPSSSLTLIPTLNSSRLSLGTSQSIKPAKEAQRPMGQGGKLQIATLFPLLHIQSPVSLPALYQPIWGLSSLSSPHPQGTQQILEDCTASLSPIAFPSITTLKCQLQIPRNTSYLQSRWAALSGSHKNSLPGNTQLSHSPKNQRATEDKERKGHPPQKDKTGYQNLELQSFQTQMPRPQHKKTTHDS